MGILDVCHKEFLKRLAEILAILFDQPPFSGFRVFFAGIGRTRVKQVEFLLEEIKN